MNSNRQQGLKTEFGGRNDEQSQIHVPDFGLRTSDSGPRFPSFEIYIEELVLHGFALGGRYRIGDAVERELARLFVEQGGLSALTRDSEIPRLDGGSFEMTVNSKAEVIGAQVAQAVYRGLSR